MYSIKLLRGAISCLIVFGLCAPASAAITLYDNQQDTSVTVDAFFNTFYVYSSDDNTGQDQSRIKMGFLPNYVGMNFSKQLGKLKLGGRSSFWVTINDSDDNPTDTAIDVRQFYGTVEGDWGQLLIGKDFTLFNRSNIFRDEILVGVGKRAALDGSGVSFGNIGSGYTYPLPSAQITYRTPNLSGFKLAVGAIDPSRTSDGGGGEENLPRFEGELTYSQTFEQGSLSAWAGFLYQSSEGGANGDVTSTGASYGLNVVFNGLSLTGSGYTGEGIGRVLGPGSGVTASNILDASGDEIESSGYLLQGSYTIGKARLVASYGHSELDTAVKQEDETAIGALIYSINDYLKLVAEYNVQTITNGSSDYDINTVALGGVINF